MAGPLAGPREAPVYYVEKVGPDRYDLRQVRYRHLRAGGGEGHPHDLIATHFTGEGMRDVIARYFADTPIDTTALDQEA